jgi:hypothetical protein
MKTVGACLFSLTAAMRHDRLRVMRRFPTLLILALGLLGASCGGSIYKVEPVMRRPLSETAKSSTAAGLTVRAEPLLTDEESQQLFEANLLLSGVLPVKVELSSGGETPAILEKARFRLTDSSGGQWKYLKGKDAAGRIMKANGVYFYNPNSKRRFVEAVSAHTLDTKTPLGQNERRQGLLFFQSPKKEPVEKPTGLKLSIERLSQPLEIELN